MIPRVAPTSRRFEAVKKSPSLSFRALRCHPEPLACHSEPLACHSERSEESRSAAQAKLREESRPGPCSVNHSAQNNIPRSARNDISWFPRVRQPTNMSNCFENRGAGVPPAVARASCPRPRARRPRHIRPRSAHFSWFPGARQRTNKSDCSGIGIFTPSTSTPK